jgi:hypothetical protein
MGASDCFLRNPLEDFDDGSVRGAHRNRSAFRNEALGAKRREVVSNQRKESFLATGPWLIASYREGTHGTSWMSLRQYITPCPLFSAETRRQFAWN